MAGITVKTTVNEAHAITTGVDDKAAALTRSLTINTFLENRGDLSSQGGMAIPELPFAFFQIPCTIFQKATELLIILRFT
ncbi:hypothetical protein N7475_007259 [Penicillium sp. IBT 31633x]|nr:hypothetical protein N7475_007259 [Penicillium sp. IBT 31633x]